MPLDPAPATARWHCEHAWLGPGRVAAGVLIEVEGERIVRVEAGVPPPPAADREVGPGSGAGAGVRVLRGLTLPGFANAHSHAFHRLLRGRTHRAGGDFWRWRELMYQAAATLDPDGYRQLARAVFAEMTLAGWTAVGEFHYLHHQPGGRPYQDPNAMGEALCAAAADAGIRLTLLDTCYLWSGFGRRVPMQ
ncbi:MAG TPA: amidohydrolase family protein, partial [Actinomycetota bacterium]